MFIAFRVKVREGEMRREALIRECERCGLTFPAVIPLPAPFPPLCYQSVFQVPLVTQRLARDVYGVQYVIQSEEER